MNYYINHITEYKFCEATKISVLSSTLQAAILTFHRQVITKYKIEKLKIWLIK